LKPIKPLKSTKKTVILLMILTAGIFFLCTYAYSQEWMPPELQEMEAKFLELNAQIATLDTYTPEDSPDFQELEKTNQLVEQLDFNKRKFDLLIQQYNIIEDKLFPFVLKYSGEHPELRREIYNKLREYTGKREKSFTELQKKINDLALMMERLEKRIERVQVAARKKVLAEESKQMVGVDKQTLSISAKVNRLEDDLRKYKMELEEEEKKLAELKKEEKERSDKIEEKRKEIIEYKKKAAAAPNEIERLISSTFARARGIRINGLEIPRLNTTKTFIYLGNTSKEVLEEKIENADIEILSLQDQREKEVRDRLIEGVVVIAIAIFMVFLIIGISRKISKKIIRQVEESETIDAHRKQRYQTLSSVILSFIKILLWTMAVLWVLGELEIDYAPFLVAAGGISLAIGFGAQSLVKDVVSGFFILMEEQFALGDYVEVGGVSGTVEKISLRTLKFRSLDGTLHIVPNGSISKVSNSTYQWSRAVVKVGVSYDDDPQKVISLLNTVAGEMAEDPQWKDSFIDEPSATGILSFGDSAVDFRVVAKTKPGDQWSIERELKIRIKKAFDQNGIEIPYNYINVIDVTKKGEK